MPRSAGLHTAGSNVAAPPRRLDRSYHSWQGWRREECLPLREVELGMAVRPKWQPGSVVLVPLGDSTWGVARLLVEPLVECFDRRTAFEDAHDVADLDGAVVIFRICVMNSAVRSDRWKLVGMHPLSEEERSRTERFFKQDPLTGALSIYIERPGIEVLETPATFDECRSLERAAVWSAEHVEDRLRDFHADIPNKWVESLRPTPVASRDLLG